MTWAVLGGLLALAGAALYWRYRWHRRSRLISLVALVREPVTFDPAVLAKVAGRVWNADLGDGEAEGKDGSVFGAGAVSMIVHGFRLVLVNSFPHPYTEDVEKAAERITDSRIRSLFREHKAWFSCDAMGLDGRTPEAEVLEWYRQLGKLFAELLDENCLLIYLPDTSLAYPINEDTEAALRSEDPAKALQETLTVPLIEVSSDDPLMRQAVEQAQAGWPKFVAAYEAEAGKKFSVKAPVTHGENTEFIWIEVTAVEGGQVYGELANHPAGLGPLRLGSKVCVPVADLNDWCYMDATGNLVGGFTLEAMRKASRRKRG